MADGFYQLTYRDLANRLGISPDAARMKANRKVKAGLWRFLPDDGPGQERRVEVPSTDLDDLPVRPARPETSDAAERDPVAEPVEAGVQVQAERPAGDERPVPVEHSAEANAPAEHFSALEHFSATEHAAVNDAGEQAVPAERSVAIEAPPPGEQPTAERVEAPGPVAAAPAERSAERSVVVEAAPGEQPTAERVEAPEPMAAAPSERSGADDPIGTDDLDLANDNGDPMVKTLAARVAHLTDRLLSEIHGREKEHAELEASQAREEMLKLEIERLCNRVSELTDALDQRRRPWWRGIMPGSDKR